MIWSFILFLISANSSTFHPVLKNDWWSIADNPDLGTLSSPEQQPVDFGIWQAADNSWQVWSCIRKTRETGKTRLFYGWQGNNLTDTSWTPLGIQMQADSKLGEEPGGLQAPFVLKLKTGYRMFYGDWNRICMAESGDGKNFERVLMNGSPALFGDPSETNTRDAMVIRNGKNFICYYVAHPNENGAIYARTSSDLINWGPSRIVSFGGRGGKGKLWHAECPFVIKMGKHFFLFRTIMYGKNNETLIYRSPDPLNFGVDDDRYFIGSIPVAAPEIFEYENEWYIACLKPSLDGIRIGRLNWIRN